MCGFEEVTNKPETAEYRPTPAMSPNATTFPNAVPPPPGILTTTDQVILGGQASCCSFVPWFMRFCEVTNFVNWWQKYKSFIAVNNALWHCHMLKISAIGLLVLIDNFAVHTFYLPFHVYEILEHWYNGLSASVGTRKNPERSIDHSSVSIINDTIIYFTWTFMELQWHQNL